MIKRLTKTIVLTAALLLNTPLLATPATDTAGWLGVQLGEVPAPLVSHFDLADTGVMVQNVAKGSPADEAGLQRWDIITAVDDWSVPAGIPAVADAIRAKGANTPVELTLLRGGDKLTVAATLRERPPDLDPQDWKYEWDTGDVLRERIDSRGRFLTRGPAGHWIWVRQK